MISALRQRSATMLVASAVTLGMLSAIAPATAQAHGTCSRTVPAPFKSGTQIASNGSVTCTYIHSSTTATKALQRYQNGVWATKNSVYASVTNTKSISLYGFAACQTGSWRSTVSFNVYSSGVLAHSMSTAASATSAFSVC